MNLNFDRVAGVGLSLATALAAVLLMLLALPQAVQASTIVVNPCTPAALHNALVAAGDGDVITFNCSPGGHTITIAQTQSLNHSFTIDGGGVITISGGSATRIFSVTADVTPTLINLTLTDGRAPFGGAVALLGGAMVISNVTFIHNVAVGNTAPGGGAIYFHARGPVTIANSRFLTNTAKSTSLDFSEGGAIEAVGTLTVTNSHFFGNVADAGGAIVQPLSHVPTFASIANSSFISNGASLGGAIFALYNLSLADDAFDHNQTIGSPHLIGPLEGGGAMFLGEGAQTTIENSKFIGNSSNNTAADAGGAIVNAGTLSVADTFFNINSSANGGGAVVNAGATLGTPSLVITSSAFLGDSSLSHGGAISNTGNLTVTASTFYTDTSALGGGALANQGHALLIHDQFVHNTANSGGGARNLSGGTLLVRASTFFSNTATGGAGGAILNNADLTLTNTTLAANYSGFNGGALSSNSGGPASAQVINSTIINNTTIGGAAGIHQGSGTLSLVNTIVAGNTPHNCQGAITDNGHNLQFGDVTCGGGFTHADPLLGPLQDNGGPLIGVLGIDLLTAAPQAGSPAINAGDNAACPAVDELALTRLGACDIGAVEFALRLYVPLLFR